MYSFNSQTLHLQYENIFYTSTSILLVFEPSITTMSLVGSLLHEHVRLHGGLVVLGESKYQEKIMFMVLDHLGHGLPTNRFGGKFLQSTMWQFKRPSICTSELFN